MDLFKAMRSFVTVAEAGGFAVAAKRLRMSPPAVSRDVAALEAKLGSRLLTRTTRQVRLTDSGRAYLVDARRILSEIAEVEASVVGAQGDLRGSLAVTAPATFGRLHVTPHIIDFARRHPRIAFTALFLDRVVDLLDEGIDVAVRIAELSDSSVTAIRVGAVRRTFYAAPAFLAAHGMPNTPADLENVDAVELAAYRSPWTFPIGGRKRVVRPKVRFLAGNAELALAAAVSGLGVARLLSYQATEAVAGGLLQPLLEAFEPAPLPVNVLHLEGRTAPKRTRSFIDDLVAGLRHTPALRN